MDRDIAKLVEGLLDCTAGRLEDVAREAGVSYSALYSWATGRRRPSEENLKRLAAVAERRAERLSRLARHLDSRLAEAEAG
ncbi:MAG: helix-turn-helix transcriptional regulator [Longimicrobiales bacterium]|nr:helix-turn-helix transcriptional regulator [Longimicrobiales bacterium]